MNLLNLAALICQGFSTSSSKQMRTVQKVKDNQCRDVVTSLDIKLHKISEQFLIQRNPSCRLLSEEDSCLGTHSFDWLKDEWMIIDPLDGSSNHALGMSNYGYMAAYLLNGRINGSVIVLPEYDQYIVFQDQQVLYAQPLPSIEAYEYGTVYYAYPPKQDELTRTARCALLDLIDANSAGMYRYGSACVGLYQLLCGRHMAFIGHGIRVWDAIAFLPVLTSRQIAVMYATKGNELTLIASHRADFINAAAQILEEHQGLTLLSFLNNDLRHQAK